MRRAAGFTLLEVMVAVALLSLGVVILLQVQARSIQLAQQARNLSVATGLARAKLYDCEEDLLKRGFSIGDYKEKGRFDDEGFESFYWECHGYQPKLPVPDVGDITEGLTAASGQGAEAASAAGSLVGAVAGAGEAAGFGVGMIAPVLAQISEILGESIRELVVIVRWQEGESWQEIQVTTHVIDKTRINQVAQGLQQMAGSIPGLPSGAPAAPTPGDEALHGGSGRGAPSGGPPRGQPPRSPGIPGGGLRR